MPSEEERKKAITGKQMGDAGEMLVAAELTLQGIPAFVAPDYWPDHDVIAEHPLRGLQRISVKARTPTRRRGNFVFYSDDDKFDWLAIVILPGEQCVDRRLFIFPRKVADQRSFESVSWKGRRGFWVHKLVAGELADYEDNFDLSLAPRTPR